MGRAKNGTKFAVMKKLASHKAIKQHKEEVLNPNKKDLTNEKLPRNVPYVSSALFFTYNTALGPPYRVLVDTNFINFSIQNKGKMLLTFDVVGLGEGHDGLLICKIIAKDPRFERLSCTHKGTYADDCIVERVTQIPGVPIMYITQHKYSIERLPEATMGGAPRI